MENYKQTDRQKKIIEGLEKVYEKLIEFKKKMKSELIILKDDEIVRMKP